MVTMTWGDQENMEPGELVVEKEETTLSDLGMGGDPSR